MYSTTVCVYIYIDNIYTGKTYLHAYAWDTWDFPTWCHSNSFAYDAEYETCHVQNEHIELYIPSSNSHVTCCHAKSVTVLCVARHVQVGGWVPLFSLHPCAGFWMQWQCMRQRPTQRSAHPSNLVPCRLFACIKTPRSNSAFCWDFTLHVGESLKLTVSEASKSTLYLQSASPQCFGLQNPQGSYQKLRISRRLGKCNTTKLPHDTFWVLWVALWRCCWMVHLVEHSMWYRQRVVSICGLMPTCLL